ncbi:hypothetical protein J6590_057172 [Homalodisca vitripennis]|nr:hypothetical protein J6590_057172 [Homalodisca vitripennis]
MFVGVDGTPKYSCQFKHKGVHPLPAVTGDVGTELASPFSKETDSHADMKNWYSPIMMERFGRGVVMSWRENNIKTEEQGSRGREVEKRGSGVLVLVFVCGKISLGVISVM